MKQPASGQMVLLGLILFAFGVVMVDVWRILAGSPVSRWAARQVTGGLFASLPFLAAAIMLPVALVKRLAVARKATTATFAVIMVMSLLWYGLAASAPSVLVSADVLFARILRFVLMPAWYVAALYLPSVTRYLDRPSEHPAQTTQEVSQ
jgi:hypothetical protein